MCACIIHPHICAGNFGTCAQFVLVQVDVFNVYAVFCMIVSRN